MQNIEEYRVFLQDATVAIADYTAARTALSIHRPRFSPLENSWGTERSLDRHQFPEQFGEEDCRQGIQTTLQNFAQSQIPTPHDVLASFDQLLVLCRPGGLRHQHFLTFFAGKDLLLAMSSGLAEMGFESPKQFRERVIKGMEESLDDVWTWLPEWNQLRAMIVA